MIQVTDLRTTEELKEKILELQSGFDLFCIRNDIIEFLPFEDAKPFIRKELSKIEALAILKKYTKENVIKEIIHYLPFAYDKAEGARGISANRSIEHFQAWLWLIKDDELLAFVSDGAANYPMYGFPMLQAIARKYAPDLVKDYNNIENDTGIPIR